MRQGQVAATALAVALLLAGCMAAEDVAPATAANATAPEPAPEPAIDHEDHAQAESPPSEAVAALEANPALTSLHSMQLYFGADGSLVDAPPEAGSVAFPPTWRTCFTEPPCAYLSFASEPSEEPWALVPGPVVFDVWVVADAPVASVPDFFDFAAWFGTTVGQSASAMATHGAIEPGEPVRVTWEAQHPDVPNVLFPGDGFQLLLLSAMTQDAATPLRLLTGGDTPSSVRFTMARVDPEALALAAPATETVTGVFSGPGFPVGGATGPSERTHAVHPIVVPADANLVRFDAVARMPAGVPDLDVDLYHGERHVGASHTPRDVEAMQLAGPALDGLRGATLDLVVTLFYGHQVEYEIVVTYR